MATQTIRNIKSFSVAFLMGSDAHTAGKMRVPAQDENLTALIRETGNDRKEIISVLTDWLNGWDFKHHAEPYHHDQY